MPKFFKEMELVWRPYTKADKSECLAFAHHLIGSFLAEGEEDDFAAFLEVAGQRGHGPAESLWAWTGHYDGQVIAVCGVMIKESFAQLSWGLLDKRFHGRGFGQAMLLHRLEWLKKNRSEVRNVFSDTAPLTEGFFARFNFMTYYRKPHYWRNKLDLVAMELTFDGPPRGLDRVDGDNFYDWPQSSSEK